MYGTNFNPKIFTDITMPAKQSYGPTTGKKSVFFRISLRNLQFSVIEGVGTESEIFTTPRNSRFMNVS